MVERKDGLSLHMSNAYTSFHHFIASHARTGERRESDFALRYDDGDGDDGNDGDERDVCGSEWE